MKRFAVVLCIIALLCCGCGTKTTEWTALQIASNMAQSQTELPEMRKAVYGSEVFGQYISDFYGIGIGELGDGTVLAASGTGACEIAVLKIKEGVDKKSVKERLQDYVEMRTASFTGYYPEQERLLRDSKIYISNGDWVVLIVCPDVSAAEKASDYCFGNPVKEGLPDFQDMTAQQSGGGSSDTWEYDHDRIVDAWNSGDRSGLDPKETAILDACKKILDECREEGQSVPEYELAIHDRLIDIMEYDTATLENYGGTPDPDNDNPYGALIGGKGICKGYTRTFQLLMDLAGIECISVYGHSDNGEEYGEHAWNQVKLDGEWYIVDTTWDDPLASFVVPAKYHHTYFNVTADNIRANHFWDEDSVPEATGTKYTWDVLRKD